MTKKFGNLIEEIKRIFRNNWVLGVVLAVLASFFMGTLTNFLNITSAILILLAIVATAVYFSYKNIKNQEKLKIIPTGEKMKNKYKGLIVFASKIAGKNEIEVNENKKRIQKEIEELDLKNDQTRMSQLDALFNETGIGHILRAIWHHSSNMKYCRVLYTKESEDCKNLAKRFINKLGLSIDPKEIELKIETPFDINDLWETLDTEIRNDLNKYGLKEKNIVYDITAGPATASCAMVLKCQPPSGGKLEYTTQTPPKELIEIEIKKEN